MNHRLWSPVLFLPLIISGCLKRAPKQAQYGPEAQPEEIKLGLQKAAAQISPFSMKKGDFVHLVTRQKFVSAAGPQQVILSEQGITILDKREDEYQIKYSLVKTNVEYKSTTEFTSTQTEDQLTLTKPSSVSTRSHASTTTLESPLSPLLRLPSNTPSPLVSSRDTPTVSKLTYHNYKSVEVDVDVTPSTRNRPDCGGLPRCKFKAQQVTYDEVYWMADGSSKKITNRFLLSAEVPYQGFIVMQCQGSTGVAGGTFTAYEQCTELEDFLHGQP